MSVEDLRRYQLHLASLGASYARMNQVRAAKYAEAKALGYELVSYVSSQCSFLTQFPHGDNCFVLEDNTVQPFVRIGSNVTLWSGNHIGHHSVIKDHCFIASQVVVSGFCTVGTSCFIGVNATFGNNLEVGDDCLIGAGAFRNQTENAWLDALGAALDRIRNEHSQ